MNKIILLMLLAMNLSCGKNTPDRTIDDTAGNEQASNPQQKKELSPEIKKIDEQVALIDLLPTNGQDYITSEMKILNLENLATTDESKAYVKTKSQELQKALKPMVKEIIEKRWTLNYSRKQLEAGIPEAIKFAYKNTQHSVTIISTTFLRDEAKYEKNGTQKKYRAEYLVVSQEHTGLFKADKYYTMTVQCTAITSVRAEDGDDISYDARVVKITEGNKQAPQSSDWK